MPYIPCFAAVKKAFRGGALEPNARLLVTSELLRLLLRIALEAAPFDEAFYLKNNPDLRAAFESGRIKDLRHHYISHGYFEGRRAAPIPFDEGWYLRTNRDVAEAVATKRIGSGQEHYAQVGELELRAPHPALVEEITHWIEAIGRPR